MISYQDLKKLLFYIVLVLMVLFIIYVGSSLFWPNVSELNIKNPQNTEFMKRQEAEWKKYRIEKQIENIWIPLERIPLNVQSTVVWAEDRHFWQHNGFDGKIMFKALIADIKTVTFKYGASTITQQLAKNLYLSPSKNPLRKLREAVLTWRLERELTKERILEIYLNTAEWGEGIYGIEAASKFYYSKSSSNLTNYEAACLASGLSNPTKFNPKVTIRSKKVEQILQLSKYNPRQLNIP